MGGTVANSVAVKVETGRSESSQTLLTTAQAIVRFLTAQYSERDGIRRRVIAGAYGIFGHGNACALGDALLPAAQELPLYQGKNEQAMVHAAIGYAKASNRLSTLACLASIGPGSTNMLTGAATATVNRLPVLLLPADTFATRLQGPVLQQIESPAAGDISANDAFRPISRFFDRITRPEQLLDALPEAIRVLLDPVETGAVTLALPQDVQGEPYDFPETFFSERIWHVTRRDAAESEIAAAVTVIGKAERPLIIAGGGVRYSHAGGALRTLAERCRIPICETFAGKSAVPYNDLLVGAIGVTGTHAANALARNADVVICIGTRLQDFITGSHSLFQHPDVRFVGVNVTGSDAYKLGAVPIVADAKLALERLEKVLAVRGYRTSDAYGREISEQREHWLGLVDEDLAQREGERVSQGRLLRVLNTQMRSDDVVITAAGSPPADVHKLWTAKAGEECHIEFGFSCMGHEIPAGIGYRLARPDRGEIYVAIGDGTYLLNNSELVTAVQEGLKVTLILFENGGFQSIRNLQMGKLGTPFATEFVRRNNEDHLLTGEPVPLDYEQNAASLGCRTYSVSTEEELRSALEAARRADGPCVIVCHVEPHRLVLDSDSWWDVGVAHTSEDDKIAELSRAHVEERRSRQRIYYNPAHD
jgi:3D-(3,5/4)-trihydroxycyclohexane-1,2-dione acylhydrolase (decyclizing)